MPATEDIGELGVHELVSHVRARTLSPVEICTHYLDRIEALNDTVNAFCAVEPDLVLQRARAAERAQMSGDQGPLLGVPLAVKDLIFTEGLRTTGGSKMYADLVPSIDDVAIARLRRAGAIVLGKTNTAEFGFSANQTENELFGATRNPWDLGTSPGGSSGGSAAAVAAGLSPAAVGSDGGGSVRIPSAFCGLLGIKPTFGRIPLFPGCRDSRYPGLSAWESVEHIGPLARNTADAALLIDIMSGPDLRDRHSLHWDHPSRVAEALPDFDLTGLRVAWSPDWNGSELVDPEVAAAVEGTASALAEMGATIVNEAPARAATRDHFAALVALDADPLVFKEAMRGHEDSVNARVRQILDREWTFAEVAEATAKRKEMYLSFTEFFGGYDVLLTPTTPFTALPVGLEGPSTIAGVTVDSPARAVIGFCYPFNLTGHPAASVPVRLSSEGMPIGVQIVVAWSRDDLLVRVAAAVEHASGFDIAQLQRGGLSV